MGIQEKHTGIVEVMQRITDETNDRIMKSSMYNSGKHGIQFIISTLTLKKIRVSFINNGLDVMQIELADNRIHRASGFTFDQTIPLDRQWKSKLTKIILRELYKIN